MPRTRFITGDGEADLFDFVCEVCGAQGRLEVALGRAAKSFDCPDECGARYVRRGSPPRLKLVRAFAPPPRGPREEAPFKPGFSEDGGRRLMGWPEIADELKRRGVCSVTKERVRQIHAIAIDKLRRRLRQMGVRTSGDAPIAMERRA